MDLPITNIKELREEIYRLKGLEQVQSIALRQRFKTPSAIFSTLRTLFPKADGHDGTQKQGFFSQDIVGIISRFVLPFTLNKTLFRHSNFLVKTLVGLVSQKASHFITEDSVSGVWDKAKSLFDKIKPKTDSAAAKTKVPVVLVVPSA